jgi:hypothetical protein
LTDPDAFGFRRCGGREPFPTEPFVVLLTVAGRAFKVRVFLDDDPFFRGCASTEVFSATRGLDGRNTAATIAPANATDPATRTPPDIA